MIRFRLLSLAFAGLALVTAGMGCSDPSHELTNVDTIQNPEYVGRVTCVECHKSETELWEGSQHDLAMQTVTTESVLGDFDNSTFEYFGVTTTFFRKDDKFMVRTDGPDGQLQDYEIAYTFGVEPLQQYLIEFPGGHLQALNICWDTRPENAGGQRWFHLYPEDAVDHDDRLHWTGPLQNWNYMCSECHSTNVRKNYRAADDHYDTTWSEIDVSCEACHGPASQHLVWARMSEKGAPLNDPKMGLVASLTDSDDGVWILEADSPTAERDPPRTSHPQLETCARCHSRRTQLNDDYRHGRPLGDTHRLTILDEHLYHADGQVLDEVYVYGSFLQSKMHESGVTCNDCHEPHTTRLRLEGNATCSVCHRQSTFDTKEHHFHPLESKGALCVECHMRARTYMVVDPRRDHSFRIPRPDLSTKIGTPNACTGCHMDRDAGWATNQLDGWYGAGRKAEIHYAEAIHAGRSWQPRAGEMLISVVEDADAPAIVRATALSLLGNHISPEVLEVVKDSLGDENSLVRREATATLEFLEPNLRAEIGLPLLSDPVRTVRIEAARVLASVARDGLTMTDRANADNGLDEYIAVQQFNADRSEGQLNLGWIASLAGDAEKAENAYRTALRITPSFIPAVINLADLYRVQHRDDESASILEDALVQSPADSDLHHALGLTRIRQQRYDEAIGHLALAVEHAPDQPRYAYVYGIALHSIGESQLALVALREAHARQPGHVDLLFVLATISRDIGDTKSMHEYASRLLEMVPEHPGAKALLETG